MTSLEITRGKGRAWCLVRSRVIVTSRVPELFGGTGKIVCGKLSRTQFLFSSRRCRHDYTPAQHHARGRRDARGRARRRGQTRGEGPPRVIAPRRPRARLGRLRRVAPRTRAGPRRDRLCRIAHMPRAAQGGVPGDQHLKARHASVLRRR